MDGQAIASAVLQYITTKLHSTCIFVTHYPSLSEVARVSLNSFARNHTNVRVSQRYPDSVRCYHMVTGSIPVVHNDR